MLTSYWLKEWIIANIVKTCRHRLDIYKSIDCRFSIIIYSNICMELETSKKTKEITHGQLTIDKRVGSSALMNNSNCNLASTACSTILDLLQYLAE